MYVHEIVKKPSLAFVLISLSLHRSHHSMSAWVSFLNPVSSSLFSSLSSSRPLWWHLVGCLLSAWGSENPILLIWWNCKKPSILTSSFFSYLTLSQGSPSALALCDSAVWTHRCQFHGSQPLDGHFKKEKEDEKKKKHCEMECAATSILAKPSELRPTGFNSSWRQNRLFRCH